MARRVSRPFRCRFAAAPEDPPGALRQRSAAVREMRAGAARQRDLIFRRSLIVSIIIGREEPQDFEAVFGLIRQAFEGGGARPTIGSNSWWRGCWNSDAFVHRTLLWSRKPGAPYAGRVYRLTKVKIVSDCAEEAGSLALAPVAVLPAYQGNGIGGRLIRAAHEKAREMGFLGSVSPCRDIRLFTPKFGYLPGR